MRVHLPRPLHGWRQFAGEVGIIVLGVLIALFFGQLIEAWDWRQSVQSAEHSMNVELLADDGPEIYQRAAMHPCLVQRLDRIRSAVTRNQSRQQIAQLIDTYWVDFQTFDSLAHDAANSSEVATHMSRADLIKYMKAYAMIPLMDRTTALESTDFGRLRALKPTGGPLSEDETTRVLTDVEALRSDDRLMWLSARWEVPTLRALGPLDRGRMLGFMADARAHYGDCIRNLGNDFPQHVPAS